MLEAVIQDSLIAFPILAWALIGLLVLIVQIITQNIRSSAVVALICMLGLSGYSIAVLDTNMVASLFFGSLVYDALTQYLNVLALLIVTAVLMISIPGIFNSEKVYRQSYEQYPEFVMCLIFAGFGAVVAISASDLSAFFLGIETLSIGSYALCGFFRTEARSTESALKYLLIGAFSTVLLLYGIVFLYGATGSTNYQDIYLTIAAGEAPLLLLAGLFLVTGLGFKLALIPFHIYTPDVYEGAPTPVTGFLASMVKVAALGVGVRIFWILFEDLTQYWQPFWISLCVVSILLGNLIALQQTKLKKLLAFSSISHAGFLGLGLIVAEPNGGSLFPMLAYLTIYSAMTIGVFALVAWIEDRQRIFMVEDLKALGLKRIGVGIMFSVFILGMAGIPPFAGFMVKFWIFQALIEQGHLWVAIAAVIGSVIGLAYYLKILVYLFMAKEEEAGASVNWPGLLDKAYSLRLVLILAFLITLVGGLSPNFYADWIFETLAAR